MSKITPLMTALHVGHKAEERIKCIDNMLFKKCEDTKETILQAFWWYRKHSIPLDRIKQAREDIEELATEQIQVYDEENPYISGVVEYVSLTEARELLDKLISESEE
jgi:hypothetical protein